MSLPNWLTNPHAEEWVGAGIGGLIALILYGLWHLIVKLVA